MNAEYTSSFVDIFSLSESYIESFYIKGKQLSFWGEGLFVIYLCSVDDILSS